MNNRPILPLTKTKLETVFDAISLLAIVSMIVYIAFEWHDLPERIPMHFNGSGEINRWGNKMSVIFPPMISLILYSGLTLLGRVPHVFNYPFPITADNALQQYENGRLFMTSLKTVITILFAFITWSVIRIAKEGNGDINLWILGIILLTLFGTIIFFIVRSYKLK
ncbi:DUF1648 domain-containing protein [Paenibacillus roseipurpureus]|uniref:DUF1648 domain-containing protein n=1 Tax=Paenibacillus roseopurpureus TaxID=2918901 RepID=A0AA96RKQ9_9BACL|nr:DUF1648 domain-containing protein [Paenibacillus sp. MBLB1832]WNR44614.1 DUF1648 domain-containing protein [Paenibacillus sp. MBLB1832]